MCRITIPLLLYLATNTGCFASLMYYKEGSTINLDLRRQNSTGSSFTIFTKDRSICFSFDGQETVLNTYNTYWNNRIFNCTINSKTMSINFENFTSEDSGLFTLYNSSVASIPVDTATLKIAKLVTFVTLFPTTITAIAEQQIHLTCVTSYCIPSANITWHWSSTDISNYSTSKTNENGSLIMTESTLIKTVGKRDNGDHVYCKASNIQGENVVSVERLVNVLYKPEVSSNLPNPYTVEEGNTATLVCTLIDANPKTNITWKWFIDDNVIDPKNDGATYAIPNITRNMTGLYKCSARNSAGISELATILVDVQYKPEVTTNIQSPYRVTEGETTSLECRVSAANPNDSISWIWLNANGNILHTGQTYVMPMIQRNQSGSYNCSAKNSVGMSLGVTIFVDVQYKPEIKTRSTYTVEEGDTVELNCIVSAANPNTSIVWRWVNIGNPSNSLSNTSTYRISNIQRNRSGTYSCNATNSVGSSAVTLVVNVQYSPTIKEKPSLIVNESEKVILTREVDSKPLPNVYWFKETEPIKNQTLVSIASYTIENSTCTDTRNYTLMASNGIGSMATTIVELIVNCKPMIEKTNITLGVTDATGIAFSILVLAYPQPQYAMEYENGSSNRQMMDTVIQNTVNNFTITFNQTLVEKTDYGTYHLRISNLFGETIVVVNVLPQRRPDNPKNIEIFCGVSSAKVQWESSFNGGDPQSFTAIALSGQHEASRSDPKPDNGESIIHYAYVQNLKPSVTYNFHIVAQNSHGNTTSDSKSCTTLKKDNQINVPLIAGGVGGGIALATVVFIAFVLLRRSTNLGKQEAGKSQRFENEVVQNGEADDDGMRDNILYVSAGPKMDERPEVAVYAAVNKTTAESNNHANVYAEVNKSRQIIGKGALCGDVKPKRGLFKKDVNRTTDGNRKQKKGKKQNGRQDVADVYENAEDIAMSSKSDDVYSNTRQKAQNKEERGYKNKDGLLYVEVQFDAKTEKRNQTIHGEDEKTDYATVEFPMAASKLDESGNEKV